jgi:hypothetical protein
MACHALIRTRDVHSVWCGQVQPGRQYHDVRMYVNALRGIAVPFCARLANETLSILAIVLVVCSPGTFSQAIAGSCNGTSAYHRTRRVR